MITDAIISFIEFTLQALLSLLTPFGTLITAFNEKVNSIIDFFIPIMEYVLYYFNVPVLIAAITITIAYLGFIVGEYFSKLLIKYITRLL